MWQIFFHTDIWISAAEVNSLLSATPGKGRETHCKNISMFFEETFVLIFWSFLTSALNSPHKTPFLDCIPAIGDCRLELQVTTKLESTSRYSIGSPMAYIFFFSNGILNSLCCGVYIIFWEEWNLTLVQFWLTTMWLSSCFAFPSDTDTVSVLQSRVPVTFKLVDQKLPRDQYGTILAWVYLL